jgi:hypothetical protein
MKDKGLIPTLNTFKKIKVAYAFKNESVVSGTPWQNQMIHTKPLQSHPH